MHQKVRTHISSRRNGSQQTHFFLKRRNFFWKEETSSGKKKILLERRNFFWKEETSSGKKKLLLERRNRRTSMMWERVSLSPIEEALSNSYDKLKSFSSSPKTRQEKVHPSTGKNPSIQNTRDKMRQEESQ
jgi:hypothetical protein